MKRVAAAIFIAILSVLPTQANEIDYLLLFTNEAAARSDATMAGNWWNGTTWRSDVTFPNLTFISSQGLSGWMIMIASNGTNATLAAHPKTILVLDRDVAVLGGTFVISSPGMTGPGRISLRFFPVPQGSKYPNPLGQ